MREEIEKVSRREHDSTCDRRFRPPVRKSRSFVQVLDKDEEIEVVGGCLIAPQCCFELHCVKCNREFGYGTKFESDVADVV